MAGGSNPTRLFNLMCRIICAERGSNPIQNAIMSMYAHLYGEAVWMKSNWGYGGGEIPEYAKLIKRRQCLLKFLGRKFVAKDNA